MMAMTFEFCLYADERLGVLSDDEIEACDFLPDAGCCDACPFFTTKEV